MSVRAGIAILSLCAVWTLPLFAWVSTDDVTVDFRRQSLRLDGRTGAFSVSDSRSPDGVYVRGVIDCGRVVRAERAFIGPECENVVLDCVRGNVTNRVGVTVGYDSVRIDAPEGIGFSGVVLAGKADTDAVIAVRRDKRPAGLDSVSGFAVPDGADGVYDRRTDALYAIDGARLRPLDSERRIGFEGRGKVAFSCRRNFLADRFHVIARLVNGHCDLKTPPVGWMTWYAVRFAASEEAVLRNARAFKRAFGGYTDERPLLWVDWEWYHEDFASHGAEGQDMLTARTTAYPRGMRAVSDELRTLGFRPALWVSMMCDVKTNSLWKAHPEWVLGEQENWSGPVWGDPTAPGYCEEFIPALVRLYRDDWGFEAFKWDTLPNVLWAFDRLRGRMHDGSLTAEQAYRKAIVTCPGGETVRIAFLLPQGADVVSASHPFDRDGDVLRLKVDSKMRADVPFAVCLMQCENERMKDR